MTDDNINKAAVVMAGESTGDFAAGAHWALGLSDPTRDDLWVRVYADALTRGETWFKASELADISVKAYDRRVRGTA